MSILTLVINLGSTTTKVALYRDLSCLEVKTYSHDKALILMPLNEQKSVRFDTVMEFLHECNVTAEELDIVSARGGLLRPIEGGTYLINEEMLGDLISKKYGDHASNLSGILANEFTKQYGIKAVITDPVVVDELCDEAKYTGLKGVRRTSIFHALNQKAVARKYAASIDKHYRDLKLIVVHMGGGITVGAHKYGKVIDVNNGLNGDGPMSPTRVGSVPVNALLKYKNDNNLSDEAIIYTASKAGGLISHLGIEDVRTVVQNIENGDKHSKEVLDAMIYQIAKEIGGKAAILKGQVDQIIFTGGVSYSDYVINGIKDYISYIGPVTVYPGELEMDALAYGAYSVIQDNNKLKYYKAGGQ